LVSIDRKAEIAARVDREPYAEIFDLVRERAARDVETPDPNVWDHDVIGRNNETAQANALLAWLFDDEAAATKAREILLSMPTDFSTNTTWDVNIRMPHPLMSFCYAWDLLRATPWFSDADASAARDRVLTVTDQFFEQFVGSVGVRQIVLGVSQNNHPIRTASAIGMVALTFPNHPRSAEWANWAVSEVAYLFGPDGRYVQADGGVSEGPFYYAFAYGPAIAFFIALHNTIDPARTFGRDCRNRQAGDPWLATDCVDGEPFTFDNPLFDERFHATVDWSINLRLPNGWRAPLSDANFGAHNGSAILTSFGGAPHTRWDFDTSPDRAAAMSWGMDLLSHHLIYLDDSIAAAPPPWTNRFMPDAGNAVFRSGWDADARWLLLVAQHGSARKTLHDHVDGTSFSLAAYGEYLLLDPGYYKPNQLDNALTAEAQSHNVILIDGEGAPEKGLLTDFGDADAFLENTLDGTKIAYAEAHQSYQETDIERSVVFVRQRYFVIADRLSSDVQTARSHAFRLGGWAGYDVPGVFEVWDCSTRCGARWERARAGVEVQIAATAPGLTVVEPLYQPLMPPHVGAFDEERTIADHGVIDAVVNAVAPDFLTVLAPYPVGSAAPQVSALDAGASAAAWYIDGADVAWLRSPGAAASLLLPNGKTLTSDAELVVIDLAEGFALIARGTHASIDGVPVVSAGPGEQVAKKE
jgi:hypothetical protein